MELFNDIHEDSSNQYCQIASGKGLEPTLTTISFRRYVHGPLDPTNMQTDM